MLEMGTPGLRWRELESGERQAGVAIRTPSSEVAHDCDQLRARSTAPAPDPTQASLSAYRVPRDDLGHVAPAAVHAARGVCPSQPGTNAQIPSGTAGASHHQACSRAHRPTQNLSIFTPDSGSNLSKSPWQLNYINPGPAWYSTWDPQVLPSGSSPHRIGCQPGFTCL